MSTILVVDDTALFRGPIAASLRLAGYTTLTANDGEEALGVTRAHLPDMILLDACMPRMDGLTMLKHLRADPALSQTPVILLTARSEQRFADEARSFQVGRCFLKSRFRMPELLACIQELLKPADAQPHLQA